VREEATRKWQLREREVRIYSDFDELIEREAQRIELVSIATPIPQHAPMHAACVARGLAVYLEKPPSLDPEVLSSMLDLDRDARHQTLVGFNFILEPARRRLKQRLLAGEFGRLRSVAFRALWPRAASYYQRARWAGRLLDDTGALLLDSCLGNATAHFSHNLLFWAGARVLDVWARPDEVEAQLYRGHDIEGADTFFVRGRTVEGVEFRIAVSHVGSALPEQRETVVCEHASILYDAYGSAEIRWANGNVEPVERAPFAPLGANYLDYLAYLAGETPRPHTTLGDSVPFVQLNALCYLSSRRIFDFPPELVVRTPATNAHRPSHFVTVRGLELATRDFVRTGEFPNFGLHESSSRRASTPAGLDDLGRAVAAMKTAVSGRLAVHV
jgi:predicted dehydrogenase